MLDRLLIDSHVFIWLLYEPEKIGPRTIALIESAEEVYISIACLWELCLKSAKGKLAYTDEEITGGVSILALETLQISKEHLLKLTDINLPHSDPFDQLIIAQGLADGLALVTVDQNLLQSSYKTLNARE